MEFGSVDTTSSSIDAVGHRSLQGFSVLVLGAT